MTAQIIIALAAGIAIGLVLEWAWVKKYGGGNQASALAQTEALARSWEAKGAAEMTGLLKQAHDTIGELTTLARGGTGGSSSSSASAPSSSAPSSSSGTGDGGAAAAIAWTLGASYTSITALSTDIARPDFARQVNVDGVPTFNVGGPNPVDFYTVAGQLTQTKPTA